MRAAFSLVVLAFLAACTVGPLPTAGEVRTPSHVDMAASLVSKTVALVGYQNGKVRAYCSGVWVSESLIVTANHCMREGAPGDLLDYVGRDDLYESGSDDLRGHVEARSAVIVKLDPDHDLALLLALAPPPHAVALPSLEAVAPGMHVHSMGHPLGLWFSFSSGDVAALRMDSEIVGKPTLMVQTTAPISPGNSGGGLYDEWGMLVGICHGSYTKGQGLNLFIHRMYVAELMARKG